MRKKLGIFLIAATLIILPGCGSNGGNADAGSGAAGSDNAPSQDSSAEEANVGDEQAAEDASAATDDTESAAKIVAPEGYHLIWNDEFDGDSLSKDDWNYEAHPKGWVNNEWQEYIPSDEYAYLKDGQLIIQPKKEGNEYFSGRVNTQSRHALKYGRIEASIKVPEGQGFLPAFWMMPENEGFYGQWPKCGEIDIMEVLGNDTKRLYGTLHYGEPHKQQQGSVELKDGDFSKEFHEFAIEWEPGQIRWYLDGEQYFETSDWFTKYDGEEEKPYPAPFNQEFHVILNVAVGGDWPGDPDDTTVFDERAAMYVDYVRMYQKDSYDENVTKPEKVREFKEADETGNFVTNSDFASDEDLTDDVDWKFLLFNGGEGEAKIQDGEITITSSNEGTEEYSVQLVQPGMPMIKGKTYTFSFEAYADEERQMKPAITAPEVDWIRYFPDTPVDLTTDWQTYSFTFEMTEEDDDKGRVEFNMGKQGSTATIHIRNVRLEEAE
ncbi:MAG: family 16 glycosylhydrolase [Lachnospiraceae bacterium]|nr:family 16 glycosylhydrolase [Lachnospiraceae bacterium]